MPPRVSEQPQKNVKKMQVSNAPRSDARAFVNRCEPTQSQTLRLNLDERARFELVRQLLAPSAAQGPP
jgi:hypothetical protein